MVQRHPTYRTDSLSANELRRLAGPRDLERSHDATELSGHFVVSRSLPRVPDSWQRDDFAGWKVAADPRLPVTRLLSADGARSGWILGYPIDPAGRLVAGTMTLPGPDGDEIRRFESALYELGGCFVAVFLGSRVCRVYLDAAGSLATVFCPSQGIATSSPYLVPYVEGCGDRSDLLRALGTPFQDGWFPFGLTARHGIDRLLPNHTLDLDTWQVTRHWPLGDLAEVEDVSGAVAEIAQCLKRNIRAVTQVRPVHMSLTAGRDSRILLACARGETERIRFFTLPSADRKAELDQGIATRIASEHGLDHLCLPAREVTASELARWVYRTGWCVGEVRGWNAAGAFAELGPDRPWLSGVGGEVGRCFYWGSRSGTPLPSMPELLRRLGLPPEGEIVERGERWLRDLPVTAASTVLDLLYIEQRLGCWGGVLSYALPDGCAFHLLPFAQRRTFEMMLRLPASYRWRQRLATDLVAMEWPELLRFPFNEPMGMRGTAARAGRFVGRIGRAIARGLATVARAR